jgi:hypothetical protein
MVILLPFPLFPNVDVNSDGFPDESNKIAQTNCLLLLNFFALDFEILIESELNCFLSFVGPPSDHPHFFITTTAPSLCSSCARHFSKTITLSCKG